MTLAQTLQVAADMDVDPRYAATARLRYLKSVMAETEREIWSARKESRYRRTPDGKAILLSIAEEGETALRLMRAEAKALQMYIDGKMSFQNNSGRIEPEMIERARNYSWEVLLGQTPQGTSKVVCCPFHDDKSASASVKLNRLICFAGCRPKNGKKGWDTITFLMERDGISFREAVLALQ